MYQQCFKTVAIVFVASQFWFNPVSGLSCLPCESSLCDEPVCPGSLVLAPCRCCKVCAKQEGEICGGLYNLAGQCDDGLSCVIEPDNGDYLQPESTPGKCEVPQKESCTKALFFGCNLVEDECVCGQAFVCSNPYEFNSQHLCYIEQQRDQNSDGDDCAVVQCAFPPTPLCPGDSYLVEGQVLPGKCCPTPSHCECLPSACDTFCPLNTEKIIISKGSGNPGSCCDEYECIGEVEVLDDDCEAVRCANLPLDWLTCPPDSIAVRDSSSSNRCCPGEPICQCPSTCDYPQCPPGVTQQISYKSTGNPGSCCDDVICSNDRVEVGCYINGTRYQHGQNYHQECQICRCVMGVGHCEPQTCPQLPCKRVTLEEGACCPICIEENPAPIFEDRIPVYEPFCWNKDRTRMYVVGQNWTSDACTFCTCAEGGIPHCKAAFCKGPTLISTTFPCPSLTDCPIGEGVCREGLERDRNGCTICKCSDGIICSPMDECQLQCPRGYVINDAGCPTCHCKERKCKQLSSCRKQCPYGYKLNKKGCDRCKCQNCPSLYMCAIKCADGMARNKYGCEVCQCKASGDHSVAVSIPSKSCFDHVRHQRYDDGETWSSDCYICVCRGGHVMCDLLKCPLLDCENPRFEEGSCCAVCPDDDLFLSSVPQSLSCNNLGSDWSDEGVTWDVDQCTSCTCHSGHVMCTSQQCPPTACDNPIYDDDSCCPRCLAPTQPSLCHRGKECRQENGSVYKSGSEFQSDPCISCKCDDGEIKCFTQTCPKNPQCPHPVLKRGQCCPQCLERPPRSLRSCEIDGQFRAHGSEWSVYSGGCMLCMCVDGRTLCEEPCCPSLSCENTTIPSGSCCPVCIRVRPSTSGNDPSSAAQPTLIVVAVVVAVLILLLIIGFLVFRRNLSCTHAHGKFEITKVPSKEKRKDYPRFEPQTSELLNVLTEEDKQVRV